MSVLYDKLLKSLDEMIGSDETTGDEEMERVETKSQSEINALTMTFANQSIEDVIENNPFKGHHVQIRGPTKIQSEREVEDRYQGRVERKMSEVVDSGVNTQKASSANRHGFRPGQYNRGINRQNKKCYWNNYKNNHTRNNNYRNHKYRNNKYRNNKYRNNNNNNKYYKHCTLKGNNNGGWNGSDGNDFRVQLDCQYRQRFHNNPNYGNVTVGDLLRFGNGDLRTFLDLGGLRQQFENNNNSNTNYNGWTENAISPYVIDPNIGDERYCSYNNFMVPLPSTPGFGHFPDAATRIGNVGCGWQGFQNRLNADDLREVINICRTEVQPESWSAVFRLLDFATSSAVIAANLGYNQGIWNIDGSQNQNIFSREDGGVVYHNQQRRSNQPTNRWNKPVNFCQ